jgi:hypothetical protein
MLKLFQGKGGKLNIVKIVITIVFIVGLAWLGAALFGGNTSNYAVVKKNREKLEIITTDNSIPSTPVSKVPLKALGVLQRNNHRRSLPGFDIEGADMPN